MDFKTVEARVSGAIDRLLENDAHLFKVDANERSITHWLGVYLQEQFDGWNVDCEYNRQIDDPKRLKSIAPLDQQAGTFDDKGLTVYPDIIVHHRGKEDNLLVIEVKKTSSAVADNFDIKKLRLYRKELNYKYSLFLRFPVGDDYDRPSMKWVE